MVNKPTSGLDIGLNGRCSKIAYGWARGTFQNRAGMPGMPAKGLDSQFSNVMDFFGHRIALTSDGIGTKIEIAERTRIYNTLGFDLIAMVVDDLAANGIEATNVTNILDVDFLDEKVIDELMQGLHKAAAVAGVAVVGGEIAELGSRTGGYGDGMHFNWCASAMGVLYPDWNPVDGSTINPGDRIVALQSRGFRSNGFSLVRRILDAEFGPLWHEKPYDQNTTWGQTVLTPSRIYCQLVSRLRHAGFDLKGIAHITGGGIPDKFGRTLRASGFGARLVNPFPPHDPMVRLMKAGSVPLDQAYRMWNMGNGMLLVLCPEEAQMVVQTACELGFPARLAGEIVEAPVITVEPGWSNGLHLEFPLLRD